MEMIRNSIVPFSVAQRLCCEWLRTYFLNYGEMSPNSKETKLNQGKIKEQYQKYYLPEAEAILENDEESPVSYTTFCSLWRVVYPQCTNRPYLSLPGKRVTFDKILSCIYNFVYLQFLCISRKVQNLW
jgi:hypothetical protein